MSLLSKSDFKIATSCSKKLIYKKLSYDTLNDENEYMEMLAQGGYIVAKYAQLTYPDGIEIKFDTIRGAIEETRRLIDQTQNITLFEATILSNEKIIRIDILEKKDKMLNLIEVKSKSHDSEDDNYNAKRKLKEYIEDVAFQTMVLKEAYPNYEIHSYLLLPDKSKRTTIEGLAGWFKVNKMIDEKFEIEELPAQGIVKFKKPLIEFKFENEPNRNEYIDNMQKDCLLTLVPVDEEIENMMNEIQQRSDIFIDILNNGIKPEHYSISKNCKNCEFNLGAEKEKNGFRECWQELASLEPNIFDLYCGGLIGHYKSGWYFNELISQRKVSFWDIDTDRFRNRKGELGSRGRRQLIQFQNTKSNSEWISSELSTILNGLKYPLHFIDFETYKGAIPHHKGMRPYELVAFQWSCHTVNSPESKPVHSEWLNWDNVFPNFLFAESLMNQIGNTGTPLMWSSFENTILRDILGQMDIFEYSNNTLKEWLINITSDKDREGRFIDMIKITLNCYFHPDMKGKTSIKSVLPAIWKNNSYLHSIPWFKKYAPDSIDNLNPYDTLPPVQGVLGTDEVIKLGIDAMRAYHELMFGSLSDNSERKEQLKKLLLQYCELDTMAMVIIWKYWMDKCM
ncbi:MAG: DUF2779 domain-containing protein [Candidatus Cloacimonetes bacterium]|nr:DUF2779 domain-containing protein [Candidatus Cloacimonadota bacterium]